MKKFLVFTICFALFLSLVVSGCATENSSTAPEEDVNPTQSTIVDNRTTVTDNRTSGGSDTEKPAAPSIVVSDTDFDVTGYQYEDMFASMYFLIITNNSNAIVSISANGIAKDANGGMIGAADFSIDVIGPGETSIGYFYFDGVKGVNSVDYSFTYDTKSYYQPVISNLIIEQTLNNSNVTIKVTNSGSTCAEFVEAHALFFDSDNNLIGHNYTYLTDNDSEIKPGKSISQQLESYKAYDHVEVYLTGRSTGKTAVASAESAVSDNDFEFTEYLYENSFATMYYVVVKSNASIPVAINANAVAKGSNGNTLGASEMSIDILGPGETSIGYFYFSDVTGVASVEYETSYDTNPYYTPVISNLNVAETINNKNVIIAVTNNGTIAAQFVEAVALFFDASNNVIEVSNSYVTDEENEIKMGKTLVEQLDAYTTFDHVEVYFTGRGN